MNTMIFGAGGLGQEVLETLNDQNIIVEAFIDDFYPLAEYEGLPVIKSDSSVLLDFCGNKGSIVIGVGEPKLREKIFNLLSGFGANFPTIIHPRAYVGKSTILREGVLVAANVTITTNVIVDVGTYININSTVGHKAYIGKFCHIAPGCNISGDCIIEDLVYLGTGSKVIEKIRVGNNSILGAGAVVAKDIRPYVLAVGVPAVVKKELK